MSGLMNEVPEERTVLEVLQQVVRSILLRWSEDERSLRHHHRRAEQHQRQLIRSAYGLGIAPKDIIEASGMTERRVFEILNLKNDPELKRRHQLLRGKNMTELTSWAEDLDNTLERLDEE